MLTCIRCGAEKHASEFYPRDRSCRECRKALVRENYRANREYYREYERKRSMLPHRINAREQYARTEKGKERMNDANRAYSRRNPEKRAAHHALNNAVRDGRVWKSECCMAPDCYSTTRLHGHHTHYGSPLVVVWLCNRCHRRLHKEHDAKSITIADKAPSPVHSST